MLDALLPGVRQQILATVLMQPDRSWYLSELAENLGVTASTLQRELASLSQAGILERRTEGNRVYFKANLECPILSDLQGLLVKTVGLIDVIKDALNPFAKRIEVAFVFGSFAESKELVSSDIDVLIVGNLGLSQVAPLLRPVQEKLNRPINPVILSPAEALDKLAKKNHFLDSVRRANKLYLWGQDSDLGKAFSRQ